MTKQRLDTTVKPETKEKLIKLSKQSGLSIGQLIDLMTSKQKVIK